MVNTSKGGRLPFSTICRLSTMSSHLCSQYHSITAVCKMLLTAIWNILSKLVPYTPVGFLCYTSCCCAIQDADDFTGSFSPAASWLYSCRRSCTSCTLNSDPVFRRLPDGLFPMPYLGLAVHTIVSNLCPFLFVVLQFGSAAMSFRHIQTVIHAPVIYILYFSFIFPAIFPNKTRFSQVLWKKSFKFSSFLMCNSQSALKNGLHPKSSK